MPETMVRTVVMNVSQYGPPFRNQPRAFHAPSSESRRSAGMPRNRMNAEFTVRMTRMVMMATIWDVVLNLPAG